MRARKAVVPIVAALFLALSAAFALASRREAERAPAVRAEPLPGEAAWPEGVLSPALAASLDEIPDTPPHLYDSGAAAETTLENF